MKRTCLFLMLIVAACSNNTNTNKLKLTALTEIDIYNEDKVYDFVFYAKEADVDSLKRSSQRDFLAGLDLSKNQKKTAEAIPLLKKSVLTFPTAKGYFELGIALRENKLPEESIDAFSVAHKLNFQPISQIFIEKASAYAQDKKFTEAYNELRTAFSTEVSNPEQIFNRPDFADFRASEAYTWFLSEYKDKLNTDPTHIAEVFIKHFPKVTLPYSIENEQVTKTVEAPALAYTFSDYVSEMLTSNFGREVNYEFYPVARLWDNELSTGLVYQQVSAFGEEYRQIFYHLVVLNNKGKKVTSKLLACNCSAEKTKTFSFDGKNIQVSEWKRKWEKPITETKIEENKIKGYESIGLVSYELKKDGQIVEIESNQSRAEN